MGLLRWYRSNCEASFIAFFIIIGFFGVSQRSFGALSTSADRRQAWLLSESGQVELSSEGREELRRGCQGSIESYCRQLVARSVKRDVEATAEAEERPIAGVKAAKSSRKAALHKGKARRHSIARGEGSKRGRRHASHRRARTLPKG